LIFDKYTEGFVAGEIKGAIKAEINGIKKIAINMLKDKEPLDKICRFTGLSQDQISTLKDK
jgi:hypothetical protein